MRIVVFVLGIVCGHRGVRWEDVYLLEEPSDTVFPLWGGKVERICEGLLLLSLLTEKTALVCATEDMSMASRHLKGRAGCLLVWEIGG